MGIPISYRYPQHPRTQPNSFAGSLSRCSTFLWLLSFLGFLSIFIISNISAIFSFKSKIDRISLTRINLIFWMTKGTDNCLIQVLDLRIIENFVILVDWEETEYIWEVVHSIYVKLTNMSIWELFQMPQYLGNFPNA